MSINTTLGKTVFHIIDSDVPTMSSLMCNVHNAVTNSQTTRCKVHKTINPQYKVHDVCVKKRKEKKKLLMIFTESHLRALECVVIV